MMQRPNVLCLFSLVLVLSITGTTTITAFEDFQYEPGSGIRDYLPDYLVNDEHHLAEMARDFRDGKLIVIENAFPEAMAKKMYDQIYDAKYALHEEYLSDGFHYHHHNVYDRADFNDFMNETFAMFDSDATKSFMTELTGSDCDGPMIATASHYHPGDHSLPHTDHLGQRTVAFIWHLSAGWRPEWGGALYWCPEHNEHAYVHASFNTLTMFVVSEDTSHFVTTVSPHAKKKRLAFNGWWHSDWEPNVDQPLEDLMATRTQRDRMTYDQYEWVREIVQEGWLEEDRHEIVEGHYNDLLDEWFTPPFYKRQY